MKKIISILLAVCMVVSMVPIQIIAEEAVSDAVFNDGERIIWDPLLSQKAAVLGADTGDIVVNLSAPAETAKTYYLYSNYTGAGIGEGWHLVSTSEIQAGMTAVSFADAATSALYDITYGNWGSQLAVVCDGATVDDFMSAYVTLYSETDVYTIELYRDSDIDFGDYSTLTVPGDTPDKYLVWNPTLYNRALILGADSATATITLNSPVDADEVYDLYYCLDGAEYGEGWYVVSPAASAPAGSTEITFDVSLSTLYDAWYGNYGKYIALVCNDQMVTNVTGGTINLTSGESIMSIPLYVNSDVSFGWLPSVSVPSGDYLKWDPTLANRSWIIGTNTGYVSATLSCALETDTTYDLYAYQSGTGIGEGWVHLSSVTALAGTNEIVFDDYSAKYVYDGIYGNWGKELAIVSNGALVSNICAASLNLVHDNGDFNQITLTSDSMVEVPDVSVTKNLIAQIWCQDTPEYYAWTPLTQSDGYEAIIPLGGTVDVVYTGDAWRNVATADGGSFLYGVQLVDETMDFDSGTVGDITTFTYQISDITFKADGYEDYVAAVSGTYTALCEAYEPAWGGIAGNTHCPGTLDFSEVAGGSDDISITSYLNSVTEVTFSVTYISHEVLAEGTGETDEEPDIDTDTDYDVITDGFSVVYNATFTESDWNSTPTIDEDSIVGAEIGGRSTLVNILPSILKIAKAEDIVSVDIGVSASNLNTWQRQEDHIDAGGVAGTDCVPGAGLYINSNWTATENDYYLPDGCVFTVTEGFDSMTSLQIEVFGCDPYAEEPVTVYLDIAVSYVENDITSEYEYVTLNVPLTEDNWSSDAGLDSTIVTYNDDGSVTADGISTFAFAIPSEVPLGETVEVNIKGTSDADFRVWLMAPWQARMSNVFKASDNGFEGGEFDLTFDLTAEDSDGSGNNTATAIQFKSSSWDTLLENITLTSVTVTYSVDPTPVPDDTTLLVQVYAQDTDYIAWTELEPAEGSVSRLSLGETIDVVFTGDAWNEITTNDSFYVGLNVVDLGITAGTTSKIKYTISDITIKAEGYDDYVAPVAGTYEKELVGYNSAWGAVDGNNLVISLDLTEAFGETAVTDYIHAITEVSLTITFDEYDFDIEPTNAYTFIFDANGGSGTMEDILLPANIWYGMPECTFTAPEGMIFDGWTATLADGSTYYGSVTSDVTFVANWRPLNIISEVEFTEFKLPEDGETLSNCLFTVPEDLGYFVSGSDVYAQPKSGGPWSICSLDDIYSSDNYYRFVVDLNAFDSSYGFDTEVSALIAGLDDGTYMSYNYGSSSGISLHIRIEGVTYETYSEQIDENIIFSVENFPVATNWWYDEWLNEDQLVEFSDILYNGNAEHIVVAFQGDLDEHLESYVFQIGLQLTDSDWTIHMFRGDMSSSDTIALHNKMEYIDGYTYVYLSVSDLITHLDGNNIDISNGTGYKFVVGAPSEYPVVGAYVTCDESITESGTWGDNITWTVTPDGVLTISGEGDMSDIDGFVPYGHLDGYITSAVIEEGVTSIGQYALNLPGITSVSIADSVTRIDFGAFSNAVSLTEIAIPAGVTEMDTNVFDGCTGLENIYVADDSAAFSDIDGVLFNKDATTLICYPAGKTASSYTVPDSVLTIDWIAFAGSVSLESITIPASVTNIDSSAFILAEKLKNIYVSEDNTYYSDIDGVLFDKNANTLLAYPYGRTAYTYAIPETVTYIGSYTFLQNNSIISLTIPESVECVDWAAFGGCSNLQKIVFLSSTTEILEDSVDESAVIYGYTGSTAEAYAEKYGRTFVALDEPEEEKTGNLNGDEKLDNKDAIHLLYHSIFGGTDYPVTEDCDYNNDGTVDRKDALRLLYHIIFGSEIYPLR